MGSNTQQFDFSVFQPVSDLAQETIEIEAQLSEINKTQASADSYQVAVLQRRLKDARDRAGMATPNDIPLALRRWIIEDDVHFDVENSKFRRRDRSGEWQLVSSTALLATRPADIADGETTIIRALKKMERVMARCGFFETLPAPDVLNMMDFSTVLQPTSGEHSAIFDTLLLSLAGIDGNEGVTYLERWITVRWNLIQQRKSGAYRMPALVFDNDSGGAGKNVFAERLLRTLFGHKLVAGNMRVNELTGDYNDNLKGKAVVMVNEVSFDATDTERLKQILGSKTLRVNPKHQAVREDDNVTAFILSGNKHGRTVKLVGNEIDRRYSVFVTEPNKSLKSHVAACEGLDCKAPNYAWLIDQTMDRLLPALDDPNEVAKWLNAILERHGGITSIEPFHRKGYQQAAEAQQSAISSFLTIAFDLAFEAVSSRDLYDAYATYAREWSSDRDILTRKAFTTTAKRYAEGRFPNFVMRKAGPKCRVSGSQTNWFFADASKTTQDCSLSDIEARL